MSVGETLHPIALEAKPHCGEMQILKDVYIAHQFQILWAYGWVGCHSMSLGRAGGLTAEERLRTSEVLFR